MEQTGEIPKLSVNLLELIRRLLRSLQENYSAFPNLIELSNPSCGVLQQYGPDRGHFQE
jgi:hypothetical protein